MNVKLNKLATNAIRKVIGWIDKENTEGAGKRWYEYLASELEHLAIIKVQYAISEDPSLV